VTVTLLKRLTLQSDASAIRVGEYNSRKPRGPSSCPIVVAATVWLWTRGAVERSAVSHWTRHFTETCSRGLHIVPRYGNRAP